MVSRVDVSRRGRSQRGGCARQRAVHSPVADAAGHADAARFPNAAGFADSYDVADGDGDADRAADDGPGSDRLTKPIGYGDAEISVTVPLR